MCESTTNENFSFQEMPIDAFIRSIAINSGRPICLLIGAGASISSGMPSAQRCIWEWKRDIFITNNPSLRDAVGELSLPGTKQTIQQWLDQRGCYPPRDSLIEYAFYAKECYPTQQDRRKFFQSYVEKSTPHIGYSLLPILTRRGLIRTAWTTNFDGLISRACAASDVTCIDIGIDTAHRTMRPHAQGELRAISLHGDYRYDELKQTNEELIQQERAFCDELASETTNYDLVVVGYSGRDSSLMDTLNFAFTGKALTRIFWCNYDGELSEPTRNLLRDVTASGREAYSVRTSGFDDLVTRIALRILDGNELQITRNKLASLAKATPQSLPFQVPQGPISVMVKSNAYRLEFPKHAFTAEISSPEGVLRRQWLNEKLPSSVGAAIDMNDRVLLIADIQKLQAAFGDALKGNLIPYPITENDVFQDKRIQSLIRKTFVRSVATYLSVETDGERRVWEKTAYAKKSHVGISYGIHKALSINLSILNGGLHAVLMPEVMAKHPNGKVADFEIAKVLRNEIYGYQHNNIFDKDINHWTERLAGREIQSFYDGYFRIEKIPIYAGLINNKQQNLPKKYEKYVRLRGVVIPDVNLVFSSFDGRLHANDPNPLKGLVNNRPYDFPLTSSGISRSTNISIICPKAYQDRVYRFLSQLHENAQPIDSERDYLHDYPGFSNAFGLPLSISQPNTPSWIDLDDTLSGNEITSAQLLLHRICGALDSLRSLQPGSIVLVFVPSRWASYKRINLDSIHFNLHDQIKAYAARQGQSTQLLREETISSSQPCRVRWWLSLALYTKSFRTPWRLESLDDNAAFVGIGYSIDSAAVLGSHILLGCSHIYNGRGEGLQFRLGRIDNPIIRHKHPFLREDDARRTGETIRQLFYDARMCLPTRVVIHKRTPFTAEEKRGFAQGLEGVQNIELIEVNFEESLRYLASKFDGDNLRIDGFPISRGSVVIQDSRSALLWAHGSAPSIKNPRFKYYQGKRRIPTPLLIRRHLGQSDVTQIASEILGLTKMNWNTFDYYSSLPATLESASSIARVGMYLDGSGPTSYDYRLLI